MLSAEDLSPVQGFLDVWVVIGPVVGGVIGSLLTAWLTRRNARAEHERAMERAHADRMATLLPSLYTAMANAARGLEGAMDDLFYDRLPGGARGGGDRVPTIDKFGPFEDALSGLNKAEDDAVLFYSGAVRQDMIDVRDACLEMRSFVRREAGGSTEPAVIWEYLGYTGTVHLMLGKLMLRMRGEVQRDPLPD